MTAFGRRRRLLSLLPLLAASCGSISIESSHDPDADFAALRTFDWLEVTPMAYTAVSEQAVLELVGAELTAHGLQHSSSSPDLLVAVDRSVEGTTNGKRSGYEFRDGRVRRYDLQAGTLVVDLLTARDRQVVWRGTANGVFKFDMPPAERQKKLAEVLHDMLADLPPGR